jgi:diguanylate cyclase (GGDEF)-like protein/PAS domain S-box-containing protein
MTTQELYRDLLDSLSEGVMVVDPGLRITYWNHGAERITGLPGSKALGARACDLLLQHRPHESSDRICGLEETLVDGEPREEALPMRHSDGHLIKVVARTTPLRDASGHVVGAAQVFSDNAASVAALERIAELQKLALLDPLTELGNRRFVEMHLNARFDTLKRYRWPFGVLFIDIDLFKRINDRFGHATGDRVLQRMARTLGSAIRSFDVVGRWGGDEFVALVVNVTPAQLDNVAAKLKSRVRETVRVGREQLSVTISVGTALARPGDTVESLLRRADEDMYLRKTADHGVAARL